MRVVCLPDMTRGRESFQLATAFFCYSVPRAKDDRRPMTSLPIQKVFDHADGNALRTKSNCANRDCAVAKGPRHFAGDALVREHLLRPVPAQFACAGVPGDFARSGSPRAHFAHGGAVGALARAGSASGHLPRSVAGPLVRAVLGHLVWVVWAAPRNVHLARPPKPGIDLTTAPLAPAGFRPEPPQPEPPSGRQP